jgi:hypothetical protein
MPQPISKIPTETAKWTGGVAQAIEFLLYKHEDLSLNPSFIKKEKENFQISVIRRENGS